MLKIPGEFKGHVTAQLTSVRDAVQDLENNMTNLNNKMGQHGGGSDSGDRGRKGYLPEKTTVPKQMNSNIEDWRAWKEDIEDFLETAKTEECKSS